MCEAIVDAFVLAFATRSCKIPTTPFSVNAAAQMVTVKQAAAAKLLSFVSEFSHRILVLMDINDAVIWPLQFSRQKHHKCIRRFAVGNTSTVDETLLNIQRACNNDGSMLAISGVAGAQ